MSWWMWILLVLALFAIWKLVRFRFSKGNYMGRSQERLVIVNKLMDDAGAALSNGTITPKKLLMLESRIYSQMVAQKTERIPDPLLADHRESYTTLIEFQLRKLQDIRQTGGEKLAQIRHEEENFLESSQQQADKASNEVIKLRSGWGLRSDPEF